MLIYNDWDKYEDYIEYNKIQWFEHLGANPVALIIAGITAIIISVGIWKYNRSV